jgi:hypothetical protein
MAGEDLWGAVTDNLSLHDEMRSVVSSASIILPDSSVSQVGAPPAPGISDPMALQPAPGIAAHMALQPMNRLWCCAPCPWCSLKVLPQNHGN